MYATCNLFNHCRILIEQNMTRQKSSSQNSPEDIEENSEDIEQEKK